MNCAWNALLSLLPDWLRQDVDKHGRDTLEEIRLRNGQPPQLRLSGGNIWLQRLCWEEDLHHCIHAASRYSPWAAATLSKGYLSGPGGHRIGVCGKVICKGGIPEGIRNVSSLCIRVARDFPGIANGLPENGSLILLGPPGWGKTTLLRDLIRTRSDRGIHIAVVDERGELFPEGFARGKTTDVLLGCPKPHGMRMLLRTMGPDCIAADEITDEEDTLAALNVSGCGVSLLATAHALDADDFRRRRVYRPLVENKVFQTAVVLHSDRHWHLERMA